MAVLPFPGSNSDIEYIAGRVRAKTDNQETEMSPGLLIRHIVSKTGGEIEVVDDPSEQEFDGGSLVIHDKKDYRIFLSPYTTPLRDNFTIAHELGHYVLHYFLAENKPPLPLWFARYGSSRIEWQANRFAAAILMPGPQFSNAYRQHNGELSILSGLFDVSLPAVEIRAKSLRLET